MLKQILLELQTRLQTGLIAGSNILLSDERLSTILQKVDTLAAKSPVFQKLSALCKAIFEDQEHLESNILEALAFLDALLITQADWKYEEETQSISILTEKAYTNIKYSQLKPLIQALSTTGSGRYDIVHSTWIRHPELFQDYRLLPYVIQDLGDTYAELADLNEEILKYCGKKIVPLLKDGFDPAGKKEMLRRIKLIVQLGGKEENAFYLKMYPLAQPAIQKEIVMGLSCDDNNRDYLMHIADSEKGKLKEAALHALSRIRDDAVDEYLLTKTKKNKKFLNYALYSNHEEIIQSLCITVKEQLEFLMKNPQLTTYDEEDALEELLSLLAYKTGDTIMDLLTWIMDHDQPLWEIRDSHKHLYKITRNFENIHPINFMHPIVTPLKISEYVMETLFHTYLKYRSEDIISMIEALYKQYPLIATPVYARMLFLEDYAHAYDRLTQCIDVKKARELYADIWKYVVYDEDKKQYVFKVKLLSDALKQDTIEILLGDTLDMRWIELLLDKKTVTKGIFKKNEEIVYGRELPLCSRIMVQLANLDDMELKDIILPYFEKNKHTICHIYIKKLYGLPIANDLTTYLKGAKCNQYEIVAITESFCTEEEAFHVFHALLSHLKSKNANNREYYYIESAIHGIEESEEY
ncbi:MULTISPECIES: hypothetical protein [Bacillota]|jgi:hypothetical protein|uniref:HEAT repeat domain-containing protein n=2 Tax=Amedibacillus TaxID=2749846 RepID=A0A7G9GQX0_9FIRM|nr:MULTISPECIES: hypothetical protein [Bacillota]QNM13202.1 hypothetical protein H9Q80_04415 [[Eubacterium] hominis]MCH4287172.1 hypothetical protein [Amedibacillus hominis]RGB49838.1 hypothetical protein DW271_18070 [Absiella sp. AM22-9]RGB52059.1 hypothetical protein DW120_20450 [Absiella sp. AM10-20]RGB64072.1 hypothetical protein DW113_16145 [Absiella sp. AM09-45]